jgi:cytochrome P450
MPGYSIPANTDIWVPAASQFDPYRFVNLDTKRGRNDFLAWGAPPHMCPARQFATTEISILVALLAMRANLRPVGEEWKEDPALEFNVVTVLYLKEEHEFVVSARGDWAGGKWTLVMAE